MGLRYKAHSCCRCYLVFTSFIVYRAKESDVPARSPKSKDFNLGPRMLRMFPHVIWLMI